MISGLCSVFAPEGVMPHAVSAISFFQLLQLNELYVYIYILPLRAVCYSQFCRCAAAIG